MNDRILDITNEGHPITDVLSLKYDISTHSLQGKVKVFIFLGAHSHKQKALLRANQQDGAKVEKFL